MKWKPSRTKMKTPNRVKVRARSPFNRDMALKHFDGACRILGHRYLFRSYSRWEGCVRADFPRDDLCREDSQAHTPNDAGWQSTQHARSIHTLKCSESFSV
jgi:hypothetical protein